MVDGREKETGVWRVRVRVEESTRSEKDHRDHERASDPHPNSRVAGCPSTLGSRVRTRKRHPGRLSFQVSGG